MGKGKKDVNRSFILNKFDQLDKTKQKSSRNHVKEFK